MTTKNSRAKAEATKEDITTPETITFEVEVQGQKLELTVLADVQDAPRKVVKTMAVISDPDQTAQSQGFATYELFDYLAGEEELAKLDNAGATLRDMTDIVLPAWQEASGLGEG